MRPKEFLETAYNQDDYVSFDKYPVFNTVLATNLFLL